MTTAYEIPFDAGTAQKFIIPLAGSLYQLSTHWCEPHACWMLDIATASGDPLILGIPVITGADLLHQQRHLGIQGKLFVQSAGDPRRVPGFAELGDSGLVFFVVEP